MSTRGFHYKLFLQIIKFYFVTYYEHTYICLSPDRLRHLRFFCWLHDCWSLLDLKTVPKSSYSSLFLPFRLYVYCSKNKRTIYSHKTHTYAKVWSHYITYNGVLFRLTIRCKSVLWLSPGRYNGNTLLCMWVKQKLTVQFFHTKESVFIK